MFPLNEKTHIMKTRNPGKYFVQYAFNDRLKRSPLIYMQNLLNNEQSVSQIKTDKKFEDS